jgi:CPA2 family monovalent cation:H+ antiporter-2
LPPAIPAALILGVLTGGTKLLTGIVAARRKGLDIKAGVRAGALLLPRGEFSIVIAGLGAGFEPALAPLSAAYVLLLAIFGPFLVRMTK